MLVQSILILDTDRCATPAKLAYLYHSLGVYISLCDEILVVGLPVFMDQLPHEKKERHTRLFFGPLAV